MRPHTGDWNEMWKADRTGSENLRKLDMAAYEWFGLLYYKLKDYSDELFPAPIESSNNSMPDLLSEKPPPRSLPRIPFTGLEDAEESSSGLEPKALLRPTK
jgi:hypothetical protein